MACKFPAEQLNVNSWKKETEAEWLQRKIVAKICHSRCPEATPRSIKG